MSIAASSFSTHVNDRIGLLESVDSGKSVRKSSSMSRWDADNSTDNSLSIVCMMSWATEAVVEERIGILQRLS
jgi:hypothetical protein